MLNVNKKESLSMTVFFWFITVMVYINRFP